MKVLVFLAISLFSLATITQAEIVTFQQGADSGFGPYLGASDTYLHEGIPDVEFGSSEELWVDEGPNGNQTLIRFDNIFGGLAGQVDLGSTITSATLTLEVFDGGNTKLPVAMLEDWNQTLTWNSAKLGGNTIAGVQRDDVEAVNFTSGPNVASTGTLVLDITSIVQDWSNGQNNFGVLIDFDGTDAVGMRSSDYFVVGDRPLLTIDAIPEPATLAFLGIGSFGLLLRRRR